MYLCWLHLYIVGRKADVVVLQVRVGINVIALRKKVFLLLVLLGGIIALALIRRRVQVQLCVCVRVSVGMEKQDTSEAQARTANVLC